MTSSARNDEDDDEDDDDDDDDDDEKKLVFLHCFSIMMMKYLHTFLDRLTDFG